MRGASNLIVGIALSLVLLGVGVAVYQHVRARAEAVASARAGGAVPVTAVAMRYNATHDVVVVINYGNTPRTSARLVYGNVIVDIGTLVPGECRVIYASRAVNATYTYADSSGALLVRRLGA